MKKLTAILLALMLVLSVTPTVFATVYTEGYLHYTISDESITITGYFGDEDTVTVPAMIAGIPVNTIASGAFAGTGIKTLNLPDTITGIEGGAVDAGVVINYNSNLPSQPRPDPAQPDPTQPTQTKPTNPTQPEPTRPKPTQPDTPKPQPPKTNQSTVTPSTAPTYAIEEVEIELALEETEAVTTAQEISNSTIETVAATEAATEPAEGSASTPIVAVIAAAAVLALGVVLVWKKKK